MDAKTIIDCHCHAGKGEGLTYHWNTDARSGNICDEHGPRELQRTILLSAQHSDYAKGNAQFRPYCRLRA